MKHEKKRWWFWRYWRFTFCCERHIAAKLGPKLLQEALNSGSKMDHSVKAMNSHRKVAFSRLFNRHRFENSELECLFRRYILRVQHASITSAVALFVVLTAAMATASFVKVPLPQLALWSICHSLHCPLHSVNWGSLPQLCLLYHHLLLYSLLCCCFTRQVQF